MLTKDTKLLFQKTDRCNYLLYSGDAILVFLEYIHYGEA